jgi:hypothetical protein
MQTSRALVAFEAVLLLGPVSALFALFGFMFAVMAAEALLSGGLRLIELGMAGLLLVSCYALVAGWVLAWNFVSFGREGLRSIAAHWWDAAILGVVVIVVSGMLAVAGHAMPPFWLGAPALIPFTHLALERAGAVG